MLDDFFDQYFPEGNNEDHQGEDYIELDLEDLIVGYNPQVLRNTEMPSGFRIRMWRKIIFNYITFKNKYIKFFKEMSDDLDEEEMKRAGMSIAVNKAWDEIKNVDIKDDNHIKALYIESDSDFEYSLEYGIKYYEGEEEYEKCAFLLKILRKCRKFST